MSNKQRSAVLFLILVAATFGLLFSVGRSAPGTTAARAELSKAPDTSANPSTPAAGEAKTDKIPKTKIIKRDGYRGPVLAMTGEERSPVKVWDADGQPVFAPYYMLSKKGLGMLDREYGLRMEGGCYYSGGAEEVLGGVLARAEGELTIAAYLHPAAVNLLSEGCILAYGPEKENPWFALTQDKDALCLCMSAPDAKKITFAEKLTAKPFHLILTIEPNAIVLYKNGAKVEALPGTRKDFAAWGKGILFVGNDAGEQHPWRGGIERLTVFNQALTATEAKATADTLLGEVHKREPVPTLEFEGTFQAQSNYPKPWDEGFTYRDVLTVCEYKITKVLRGEYKGITIRVAEWVYVDRIFLTNSQKKVGTNYRLVVEPLEINPQLSTLQRADTLEMDLDASVFYDLSPIIALPAEQQPKRLAELKE